MQDCSEPPGMELGEEEGGVFGWEILISGLRGGKETVRMVWEGKHVLGEQYPGFHLHAQPNSVAPSLFSLSLLYKHISQIRTSAHVSPALSYVCLPKCLLMCFSFWILDSL